MKTLNTSPKLAKLLGGKTVVTNDDELDNLQHEADQFGLYIRTLPNKDRHGLLDQYTAWIGGPRPEQA